ncbi:MAG TPA: DUF4388 domain-containing protein [Myxococcota bacterium]|jgi:hypothetical protein
MALRGTLGDFGLPDIFQLVGHQQKTGVLLLKDREVEVKIYFVEGNVVKAEQSSRERAELLGNMLVRAGVVAQGQLDSALTTQQRTLRRLGDILIEIGACDRAQLKEMARLQTTETIYRLFMWRKGTYEFTAAPVDYDEQSYEPIRAENVLMEGFRMVDEWPAVRKVIPSARCQFTVQREPPPEAAAQNDDDILAGMAEAFGDKSDKSAASPASRIGRAERRVFPLVNTQRTVQDIIDLSRLGEFETTKALANLVTGGFLRVVLPQLEEKPRDSEPFTIRRAWAATAPVITRVALYAVVAAAVGGLVRLASAGDIGVLSDSDAAVVHRAALRDKTGEIMRARLSQAIDTFRLSEGRYPATLDELVAKEYVDESELSFPFASRYAYHANPGGDGYALSLPLR